MPEAIDGGRRRARKRFGQHFLHDPAVIARILAAVGLEPGDRAVEIGPGRGALTEGLLRAAGRLDAVEIDRDLAAELRRRLGPRGLVLHEQDALEMDWRELARARGGSLRVIGNLPYNISSPLLMRLVEAGEAVRDMHCMLQKELVDRIVASPGGRDYGRLGVMLGPFVQATRLFELGAGAFQPPPRVRSALVRLTVRASPPEWARSPWYGRVVAVAFSQRRKTLRNALASLLSAAQIEALRIDPAARPETLSPAQFGALAQAAGAVIH